jgi:CubicO group peptidase (beta-lactamase class C family)
MIYRSSPRVWALLAALLLVLTGAPLAAPPARAAAGIPLSYFDPSSTGWLSVRNMPAADHQEFFNQKADAGYIMIDAERMEIGGQLRVSSVWQTNSDGRGWASRSNLTSDEFSTYWQQYADAGYRLIDQDAYELGGAIHYAGIWMQNSEGLGWYSYRNQSSAEFGATFDDLSSKGFMLVDVESYLAGGARLYSQIWVENEAGLGWIERRDMTSEEYAGFFDEYAAAGYRVIDLESYMLGNEAQRYAAIWVQNTSGRGWYAYRDMSAQGFGNRWSQLRDAGYRLIDFEIYETAEGTRYAGVWRQNTSRPDWRYKDAVNALADQYIADNDLAGMAVAIAVDGKFVYLRGLGHANIAQDKWFHSGTIARVASGCKAISGVLAMELEEQGLIDLDDATRDHVPALPAFHTHTLRQLLSNRSGVRHYFDGADPTKNVDDQYDWQTTAAGLFANDPLSFAPGTDYGYSTHGYTLLGAAMEGELGDPASEILWERLSQPYGLPTLRAEDRSVPNAHRATLYTGTNSGPETVVADNISWKLDGGGCETSTADYARLGLKLLGGSILSQASLDTMWTPPDGQSNYALGWDTGTHLGEQVVAKSGAQTGAASYIRIYPERGITIAILSNQRGHTPRNLALDIGALLLNAGVGNLVAGEPADELAQADDSADEPAEELGAPELGIPLTISLPPTATDDSSEPAAEPFAEGSAQYRVLLPLLAR